MLRSWFDTSDLFNEAYWVLLSSWSTWTLVGLGVLSTLTIFLAWRTGRGLQRRRRIVLFGLRIVTVLTVWLMFLQPGVRLEHVSRVRNHVPIVLDQSRSMDLAGESAKASRIRSAQTMLQANRAVLDDWQKTHQVDTYTLSDRTRPVTDLASVKAIGDASRLMSTLDDLGARFEPSDLGAVILISDGADNGHLATPESVKTPTPAVVSTIKRLGVPIHTVFTGPKKAPDDIAILSVRHDDFAFVRNAVSIEVDIRVTGYENKIFPVTLRQDDLVLGTRSLTVEPEKKTHRFEFEFVPDQTGKSVFTLEVGQAPNEPITVNNRYQFTMRIIRDKIRVLQVVGRPSWDERYLRKLLKKNPNVDLISFFILRTPNSIDPARKGELSLIPFPTRELFEEQLGSFDLVIFQNFTYRGFRMRRYLPRIRDYVKSGGGFVMIGGDLSFASGGYAGTPLEDILPVVLPTSRTGLIHEGRFKPNLTDAGRYHPITRLSPIPEDNLAAWTSLPELSGMNTVRGIRKGASVLLTHPSERVGQQAAPILLAQEMGRGRVVNMMTDSTWYWDFVSTGKGSDNRNYYKFWGNMIRWLIRDPSLRPLKITVDRDRYPLGVPVSATVQVFGRDYQPAPKASITLKFFSHVAKDLDSQKPIKVIEGQTTQFGEFVARFTPPTDGAWTVKAESDVTGPLEDTDVFVVATDPVELKDPAPRAGPLKLISRLSGGEFRSLSDGLDGLAVIVPKVLKVNRRKDVAVWSSFWFLLMALIAPSIEWFLRRRWGLL